MGKTHAEAYLSIPHVNIVAIGDAHGNCVNSWPVPHGTKVYSDVEQVIHETDADVVDVCLPTHLHEECVIKAARRGLHILCEKPLSLTTASADRMVTAVRNSGVVFMVGQVLRFSTHYLKVRELVDGGAIGEPIYAHASRFSEPPQWAQWFRDPDKSGGALFDLQIHDLDYAMHLFGRPDSLVTRGVQSESGCWDQVCNVLSYPGRQVVIEASYRMPVGWPFTCSLRIVGTAGAIEYGFRVAGNVDVIAQAEHSLVLYRNGKPAETFVIEDRSPYLQQLRYFIECVLKKKSPELVPAEQSRNVIAVLEASRQSLESGQPVALTHIPAGVFRRPEQTGSSDGH